MFASALPRVLASVALALLAVACSRPSSSTVPAGSGVEVQLLFDRYLSIVENVPVGTRLRWFDLDTQEFGEGRVGSEPTVRVPASTLLVLAVESEGAPRDGWAFELLDTDALRRSSGSHVPDVEVTPVRHAKLRTGPGPSGLEVRVESGTLDRVAPVADHLVEELEGLLVRDWVLPREVLILSSELEPALRERLATRGV